MRIIDGRTIEVDCDSCASTFTTTRGEDGEPDEILCSECKRTWEELRAELARERDRVWFETFLSFPFKALPTPNPWPSPELPCEYCGDPEHHVSNCPDLRDYRDYQDLMDAADQAAYYSPEWTDK